MSKSFLTCSAHFSTRLNSCTCFQRDSDKPSTECNSVDETVANPEIDNPDEAKKLVETMLETNGVQMSTGSY